MLICPVCESVFPDGAAERCPHDQSPLYVIGDDSASRKALAAGDIVAGKYELIEEMARRGGAGRTFRARQIQLEREVELRLLPENSITRPSDHARFRREVETWGRLRDDHLVRLYDSGFAEGNAPYMALEYFSSGSVGDVLRAERTVSVAQCIDILTQILSGLIAAHRANVLHRDITPDTIMIEADQSERIHARLTGFGLAKHLGDDDDDPTAITMTGQVIGNPAYMAPETIMRGILDPRTDIYALGVTTYEMVTGERPFPGRSLAEMLAAHIQGTPRKPTSLRPDIPPDLEGLIEKMIANDASARFQSAEQVLYQLVNRKEHMVQAEPVREKRSSQFKKSDWWLIGLLTFITLLAALIVSI
ncbi:MAG: serine/threonine-protein kinase [Myxococcota bacterium]|nr:serine/threonine-protein kinase [Myxococcota bacterium]